MVDRATDLLELAGAILIVVGIALYAMPLALIVAGLFLVVAANSVARPPVGAVSHTRTGRRPRRAA